MFSKEVGGMFVMNKNVLGNGGSQCRNMNNVFIFRDPVVRVTSNSLLQGDKVKYTF